MAIANYDYTKQLTNLKNAQRNAAIADLQANRDRAISNLDAEQQQNTANYAAQRSTANAQNRLAARNFQEYLANTGRANSGLGAQAAMQYNNNLNTNLNSIYGAENAANADILRRRSDVANTYNSGLAKSNAEIEANYIQSLLDERAKRFERDMQIAQQKQAEKEFQESIRQFNKNYDLQKRNFSSGSGGGRSTSSRSYYSAPKQSAAKTNQSKNIQVAKNAVGGLTWTNNSTVDKKPSTKSNTKANTTKKSGGGGGHSFGSSKQAQKKLPKKKTSVQVQVKVRK